MNGKEWNEMELSILDWMFYNKGMEMNGILSNLVWEQHERNWMELNHFMTILLLDHYFKIKGWIYRGILGVLVKKSLNLIPFPPIPLNFGGNENRF